MTTIEPSPEEIETHVTGYEHGIEKGLMLSASPWAKLTKRELFAAMAMQGLCANSVPGSHHVPANLVKEAVTYADALLSELNRDEEAQE